jgi:hypothetical protein
MSRSTHTESELRRINEEVWSHPPARGQERTDATCPACGAHVQVRVFGSGTGAHCGAEVLEVNCDGCGRAGCVKPSESRCPDFDSEQMQAIVELHQRGRVPVCPICSTPLRLIDAHTLGTLHYSACCHRGGGMGQLSFPR